MNQARVQVACLAVLLLLCSCGKNLSAPVTIGIISAKVADLILNKTVLDPVWDFLFGKAAARHLDAVKDDFAKIAAQQVINAMIPTAHAGENEFRCEPREAEEDCRNRAASIAEYQFNIYAHSLVSSFARCRDEIALSPTTGAFDYTRQVDLITECVSNSGFQKEVALIMSHIKRNVS